MIILHDMDIFAVLEVFPRISFLPMPLMLRYKLPIQSQILIRMGLIIWPHWSQYIDRNYPVDGNYCLK